jgi:low temperature requirement protein LtrA
VADELVIAHPGGHVEPAAAFALIGGPALYLAGNVFFKRASAKYYPLSHLVGLVLLGALVPLHALLAPLALSAATTAVLIVVAVWETRSLRGQAHRPSVAH